MVIIESYSFKCEICGSNTDDFYTKENDDTIFCGYCFKVNGA